MSSLSETAASTVVALHIGYFLFVVASSVAITVAPMKGWDWIRNPWFRLANLASVFVVIAEDIFGWQCPLNTLEWNLRTTSSGIVAAASSPVGQLLEFLLREAIPGWAIHAMYWCLGALMIVMLFVNPPRFRRQESRDYA